MDVMNGMDVEEVFIDKFPYKGKQYPISGVSVRWLSTVGPEGEAEYGLRLFTAHAGAEIPIHNHFYHQTMYILTGKFECYQYDGKTDELAETHLCGPGDAVYVPSMEPHGMKNIGDEPATFLCCICNVYDDDD